ncbi:restriction endonuclease subunit S [Xanthomonas hydrangeae]|uniref:Restriction endonuclease subunit S n=1 Tax=Xanthomonas hydrangeae TaxID=2775159 RepID=A0AAU0B725_9XANT|nr:restriction endonuclease subunit S [Xanthomonas hydrangeae]WOB48520.1 restriction endonuclease subunit S [Xanthomonas hydrangeae]
MRSKVEEVSVVQRAKEAVPMLRFPAFSGKWEKKQIGEIAEIYKGKGVAKGDISSDGVYQCIRYGELYTVYEEVITDVFSRTSLPSISLFFNEPYDVIIPSSGEKKEDIATAACVVPGGIALGGDLNVLRSRVNGVFLSYYLNGPLRVIIARVAQGDSVVHLYPHQIEKLPVSIPSRDEQQEISDCLSSLDAYIGAEIRELDALKAHKHGLMQQLFPAEGQPLPQLRFPRFEGGWRPSRLGDLAEFKKGKGIAKAEISTNGAMSCIRYGELYTTYGEVITHVVSRTSVPAHQLFVGETNDVLIPSSGETKEDIATAACVLSDDVAYGGDLIVIRTKVNGVFLSYLLNGTLRKSIARVAQGNAVVHLYPAQLAKIDLSVPCTEEQNKIASCLLSIDNLIAAQSRKINVSKEHKKGLMQGLFPTMEECAP